MNTNTSLPVYHWEINQRLVDKSSEKYRLGAMGCAAVSAACKTLFPTWAIIESPNLSMNVIRPQVKLIKK